MWARIMRDEFGAVDPKSQMLRFHTQTAGVQLTAQQPEVNLARVTIQALAAVLGGTQSLHTNAYDEALGLPTDATARVARNTLLILQEESGIPHVIDPWGGSYFMESLTASVADGPSVIVPLLSRAPAVVKDAPFEMVNSPELSASGASAANESRNSSPAFMIT